MKELSGMEKTGPAIYVTTAEDGRVSLSTVDAYGHTENYPETTPAEILVHREELDFTPLRDEVMRLWQTYPLDGDDRPQKKAELSRLAEEVCQEAESLRELDPLGYFYVTAQLELFLPRLDTALTSEDIDLMEVGATLITTLEEPAWSQIPLRNMFEVAFDGMERATQRERYELLTSTYASVVPPVVDRYYPVRRLTEPEGDVPLSTIRLEYRVETLDDLHHLLLSLYFAQKKQRIVRCECCWGYFIPPTTRPALFCDRVIDGKSCKQVGPGLRHMEGLNRDDALMAYDTLRYRMKARRDRYITPGRRGDKDLIPVDYLTFEDWDVTAKAARKAYLDGEITSEEFLRRIDLFHDLDSYEVDAPQGRGKSAWRKWVEADIRFDPYREFTDFMMLDLNATTPHWELTPGEELAQKAHGDDLPLRDQKAICGKGAATQPEPSQQQESDEEAVQLLSEVLIR